MALLETVLETGHKVMLFHMGQAMFADDMLTQLAGDAGDRHWSVVAGVMGVSYLK